MWQPEWMRQRLAGYTIEDLLTNPDDAHYEVTDGVIRPIPFHSPDHQELCGLVTDWFRKHTPAHLRAVHQLSIAFAVDSTREADVVVFGSEARNDHAFLRPHEVALVVEIEDVNTRHTDRVIKPAEYAAARIRHYWRIEQHPVHLYAYELGEDGHYALVADSAELIELDRPFPIKLSLAEIAP
jgi:hypothetical protein